MAVAVLRLPFGAVVDFVAIQGVTRGSCHFFIAFTPIFFSQGHALMSVSQSYPLHNPFRGKDHCLSTQKVFIA